MLFTFSGLKVLRERERDVYLSLSLSRKSFPLIKNCGIGLVFERKLIRVAQKKFSVGSDNISYLQPNDIEQSHEV